MRHFGCVLLMLLGLTACAAPPPPSLSQPVRVATHVSIDLPRPADFGRETRLAQLVTARYGETVFTFEGHLLIGPRRVLLTCLDSLGRVALTVTWTDDGIIAKKEPWLPKELLPENILADIVLLFWPEPVVRQAIAPSGAQLTVTQAGRVIMAQGQEVIRADILASAAGQPRHIVYRNLEWHYSLDIQSQELPP